MSRERHRQLKELFLTAVELPPEERDAWLETAVGGDEELAREVRGLIHLEESTAPSVLEMPAFVAAGLTPDPRESVDDDEPDPPVRDWDRYEIGERLGVGGMGEVYKAFDPRLKRHVALKFLRPASGADSTRFVREAEAQARVAHDNVLEVYETGRVEGRQYIAMRYVEGPTLLDTREDTTVEQKVGLMVQVAEAIHAAHRKGLVHRDIKPSNILVEREVGLPAKAYVMDFGIAADLDRLEGLTCTGEMIGTPWYMAPERVGGGAERLDRRADVYSLGVTMYEYLSGERPFAASTPVEMLAVLQDGEARPLRQVMAGVPVDLETIVMKCLEHEPQRRYASARALADDLRRYLDGEPIDARRPTLAYRLLRKARRHRSIVVVSALALLVLAFAGGASLRLRREAREREELARDFARRVTEIEFVMRMAHVAPIHNVRQEKETARALMADIRERLAETGFLAEGSGYYALGRGYLAMGEYHRAREQLERAWSRGYRDPSLARVLGRVLADQYADELKTALSIASAELREARLADLDRELRRPALSFLRAGSRAGDDAQDYESALVAFLEGRYDEALRHARRGWTRFSWRYEARTLEGDVHVVVGYGLWHAGAHDGAVERWVRAAAAYRAAAAAGRSDPAAHLDQCSLAEVLIETQPQLTQSGLEQVFWRGSQACDQALFADSSVAEVHRVRAALFTAMARAELELGVGAQPYLQMALDAARAAVDQRPSDPMSHLVQGEAELVAAAAARARGDDPEEVLGQARAALLRAEDLAPGTVEAYSPDGWPLIAQSVSTS